MSMIVSMAEDRLLPDLLRLLVLEVSISLLAVA
jgi:hypothetical protein